MTRGTNRLLSQCLTGALVAGGVAAATPSFAQSDFYKDKAINFTISTAPSGGHLVYGRLLTAHMGKYIPGNPHFVVRFMPGAGGLKATNYLYSIAPKDGSEFGLVHTTVPFAPLYGQEAANFDGTKFNYIGAMDTSDGLCIAWHQSGLKTWQDIFDKGFIVGGTGSGSSMETLPRLLNALFNTNIKIISGYKGGDDVYLAMERGEVHGRCGGLVASVSTARPDWFPEKKVAVLIQVSLKRNQKFPDVPSVLEFAKDPRTKEILEFALASQEMDRPILAPPGVPADRIALLRKAFDATMKDEQFLAEAQKMRISIDPQSGDAVAKLVARSYGMPKAIIEAASKAMNPG